jgi:hypothetical protein
VFYIYIYIYDCYIKYLQSISGCKNSGKYMKSTAGFDGRGREGCDKSE